MSEDKELLELENEGCDCGDDCDCDDDCDCGDEGCGCGCGEHDHEEEIMTITLEDGTELECAIVAIFPVEDKDYIALMPLDREEEGEVLLYGFEEYEDGSYELLSIESDEEYDLVTKAFDEILEEEDMYDLFEDDEEFEEELEDEE